MTGEVDAVARLYLALGRINRALRRDATAAPVGHGGLSALAALTQEGPLRVGELAVREGVGAPTMTRLVAVLEQQGHVKREPDPRDGRASVVRVTASGAEVVSEGRAARLAALRRRVDALGPQDRALIAAATPALEALAAPPDESPPR